MIIICGRHMFRDPTYDRPFRPPPSVLFSRPLYLLSSSYLTPVLPPLSLSPLPVSGPLYAPFSQTHIAVCLPPSFSPSLCTFSRSVPLVSLSLPTLRSSRFSVSLLSLRQL